MPTVYQYHAFAAAGGLMSYGGSFAEPFRQVGIHWPYSVVQSAKVDLIIKTAKALGLTVPMSLLGRADEVIE
jgi:putative ABC transport system substrate-binding protein